MTICSCAAFLPSPNRYAHSLRAGHALALLRSPQSIRGLPVLLGRGLDSEVGVEARGRSAETVVNLAGERMLEQVAFCWKIHHDVKRRAYLTWP